MEVEKTKFPAYNGFILTAETKRITPINPFKLNHNNTRLFHHVTKRWANVQGDPRQYREITWDTEMDHKDYTYEIKLYSIWKPEAGQENERFAFYTDTSKSPKGCFLRIGDLTSRLQGEPADIEKLYKEDWHKEDQHEMCIPVWPINGGKASMEPFSWTKRSNGNFVKQFTIHLNIAQRASVSIVEGWSPHLRYWDKKETASFLILVDETICRSSRVEEFVEDINENYNIYFKPKCKVYPMGAAGEILKQYTILSEHILGFYQTLIFTKDLERLERNGTFGGGRAFPHSKLIQRIQDEHFKTSIVTPVPTSTNVTRLKILGAHQMFRTPSQIAVMNNLATVTIAKTFWPNAGSLSRRTEWLHRSAFGFGGLGEDNVQPGSSQTMGNLVFGTFEANNVMLRLEASIKNLTIHEDKRRHIGGNAQSLVSTRLQFPADVWDGRPEYSWCAPQLEYRWNFWCTPMNYALDRSRNIDLFSMRHPTRFEAYLDELIEDEFYADQTPLVAIEETPALIDVLQADAVAYVATGSAPEDEGEE